jgi:flagellar biosynthetic protein FliO
MLFMVLALLLLAFYLLRRFLAARGGNAPRDYIRVLTVHHLSPKEKLVLVNVLDETILIGVTPGRISKIKVMESRVDFPPDVKGPLSKNSDSRFSDLLSRTLNRSSPKSKKDSQKNEYTRNIPGDKVQDAKKNSNE